MIEWCLTPQYTITPKLCFTEWLNGVFTLTFVIDINPWENCNDCQFMPRYRWNVAKLELNTIQSFCEAEFRCDCILWSWTPFNHSSLQFSQGLISITNVSVNTSYMKHKQIIYLCLAKWIWTHCNNIDIDKKYYFMQFWTHCKVWYNIMWQSLSVTWDRSVVFSGYSGFLHQ
jgi:hypothetical protein